MDLELNGFGVDLELNGFDVKGFDVKVWSEFGVEAKGVLKRIVGYGGKG